MLKNVYNQNRPSVQKTKIKINREAINANCCVTLKLVITT